MNCYYYAIFALILMLLLCSCAGGDAKNPVVADVTDVSKADASDAASEIDTEPAVSCDSVCFKWRPVNLEEWGVPEYPIDVREFECNYKGLTPGECPEGHHCGAEIVESSTYEDHIIPCVADQKGPYALEFDYQPTLEMVEVEIWFTLNGAPADWSGTPGSLTVLTSLGPDLDAQLPPAGQPLQLDLFPGEHFFWFEFTEENIGGSSLPQGYPTGYLTVATAGSVTIDLLAIETSLEVSLNGAILPSLPEDEPGQLVFILAGREISRGTGLCFGPGDSLSQPLRLWPDTYDIAVYQMEAGHSLLPRGTMLVEQVVEVKEPGTPVQIAIETVEVSGTVRMNGEDLPLGEDSGRVRFFHFLRPPASSIQHEVSSLICKTNGAEPHPVFEVSTTRPATYQGMVYGGEYSIRYEGSSATIAGVPDGSFTAYSTEPAGGVKDIEFTTVDVTGSVTYNGLPPSEMPELELAKLRFGIIKVVPGVDGTFQMPLYGETVYDVEATLKTEGDMVPNIADVPLLEDWTCSSEPLALDVAAHLVTVDLSANGVPLEELLGEECWKLGKIEVEMLEATTSPHPGSSHRTWEFGVVPGTGEVVMPLPAGATRVAFLNSSCDALPLGALDMGVVDVQDSMILSEDLAGVDVAVDLTMNGEEWPVADAADGRGRIGFHSSLLSAGTSIDLPLSGPAIVEATLLPGKYSVSYVCASLLDDCSILPLSHIPLAMHVVFE